jgi:hypothetical protein
MKLDTRCLMFAAFAGLACCAIAQDLAVNETTATWDTTQRRKKQSIVLMRGESYPYTLTAKNGTSPIDLSPTNTFVLWRINGSGETDYTNTYIASTGTIENATNGTVSFLLTPRDTNLRPGYYDGYIDAWQADGTNITRKGTLQTQIIDIRYSPYLNDTNYLGPLPFGAEAIERIVDGAIAIETNTRAAADTALQGSINTNAAAIALETNNRAQADTLLQGAISTNSAAISAETAGRTNADHGLSLRIDSLEGVALTNETDPAFAAARAAGFTVRNINIGPNTDDILHTQADAKITLGGGNAWNTGAMLELGGDAYAGVDVDNGSSQLLLKNNASRFRVRDREGWTDIATFWGSGQIVTPHATDTGSDNLVKYGVLESLFAKQTSVTAEAESRMSGDAALQAQVDSLDLATTAVCIGGPYHPDYFTLALLPWPYNAVTYGETQQYYSVYASTEVVDSEAGYLLGPDILRSTGWTNDVDYVAVTNVEIISTTITNYDFMGGADTHEWDAVQWQTGLTPGETGVFRAVLGGYQVEREIVYQSENLYTNHVYQGDVPGSLRAYINTSIYSRISEGMDTSVYVSNTWERNTSCWVNGYDITSASPYNTANGQYYAGTLITPQHYIRATHYPNMAATNLIGEQLMFVDNTNGVHWRTVIDERSADGSDDWNLCDATVGLLDSPLPSSITPAKLLNRADSVRFSGKYCTMPPLYGIYGFYLNRREQAYPTMYNVDYPNWLLRPLVVCWGIKEMEYDYFISGDSGSPMYLIIGTNTVLYGTLTTGMGGAANLPMFAEQIEARMQEMGHTSYTNVTYVNLNAWTEYGAPPAPGS